MSLSVLINTRLVPGSAGNILDWFQLWRLRVCWLCSLFVDPLDSFIYLAFAKEDIKQALKEYDQEKEEYSTTFSSITLDKCSRILSKCQLTVIAEDVDVPSSSQSFTPFMWDDGRSEDVQMNDIVTHLKLQLTKFGVQFGQNGFDVYDVHKDKNFLTVEDDKLARIRGGTDCVIAPYGIEPESLATQLCVVLEIKTRKVVSENGLQSFSPQGTSEFLAAQYYSNQPCLAVVTDISSGAHVWTLGSSGDLIIKYKVHSLCTMAAMIAKHLSSSCTSKRNYRLEVYDNAGLSSSSAAGDSAGSALVQYKKQRVTQLSLSIADFVQAYMDQGGFPLGNRYYDEDNRSCNGWHTMYT